MPNCQTVCLPIDAIPYYKVLYLNVLPKKFLTLLLMLPYPSYQDHQSFLTNSSLFFYFICGIIPDDTDNMQTTHKFILCSNLIVSGVQISLNCVWQISNNMLQLNANKTEVIYFHSNRTMPPSLPIKIGDSLMKPDISVKNLGVFFDTSLSMHTHITYLCKLAYFHLFNISSIRRYITKDVTKRLSIV